jgi:hypothetical protein
MAVGICRFLFFWCALCAVGASLPAMRVSAAPAELVTYAFEGVLHEDVGPSYPLPAGQRITGHYTFDLLSPGTTAGGDNTVTFYVGAIKSLSVTLAGIGTGSTSTGDIYLGDPVQVTGDFNYLADFYQVLAPARGITFPSPSGMYQLASIFLRLHDVDQQGLSSESLSAVPPDLSLFLDHAAQPRPHDYAEILLGIQAPGGGTIFPWFRMTSLTAIPEPSSMAGIIALLAGCLDLKRRGTGRSVRTKLEPQSARRCRRGARLPGGGGGAGFAGSSEAGAASPSPGAPARCGGPP